MRSDRGLSLAEVVISSFLLAACLVVFGSLLMTSTRYSSRQQQSLIAFMVAERNMEDVRRLARSVGPGGYGFDSLPELIGPVEDSQESEYLVTRRIQAWQTASPCQSLESIQHPSGIRVLSGSLKRVEIEVKWARGHYSLVGLVGDPRRELADPPLSVVPMSPLPTTLEVEKTVEFTAILKDRFDRPIADAMSVWNASPYGVPVTMNSSRDGRRCSMRNRMQLGSEPVAYPGGLAGLMVEAYYAGKGQLVESPLVPLEAR